MDKELKSLTSTVQEALSLLTSETADEIIGSPPDEYGVLIKAVEALNRMDFLRAVGGGMINTKRARKMAAQSMTVALQLVHYAYALGKQAGMRE